jgi:hypothetical protein
MEAGNLGMDAIYHDGVYKVDQ